MWVIEPASDLIKAWKPKDPVAKVVEPPRPVAPLRACHICSANTNSMLDRTYKPTCGACYQLISQRGFGPGWGQDQRLIPTAPMRFDRVDGPVNDVYVKPKPEFIEPRGRAPIPGTDEEV